VPLCPLLVSCEMLVMLPDLRAWKFKAVRLAVEEHAILLEALLRPGERQPAMSQMSHDPSHTLQKCHHKRTTPQREKGVSPISLTGNGSRKFRLDVISAMCSEDKYFCSYRLERGLVRRSSMRTLLRLRRVAPNTVHRVQSLVFCGCGASNSGPLSSD
jgi:hypothetical protein